MDTYLYLIHPFREDFFQCPTPHEELAIEEHFEYLKRANEAGNLILAGPCLDDTFGIVFFYADDLASANEFMYNDPSVKNNVMVGELHPIRISLQEKFTDHHPNKNK